MPSDLESTIRFLEETNDPATAFFSYTVDDTGEFGLIKANKEGLRLYAAEILRKSLQFDDAQFDEAQPDEAQPGDVQPSERQRPDGKGKDQDEPLLFPPTQWMFSETGYDLIAGILPRRQSRRELIAEQMPFRRHTVSRQRKTPFVLFILMCITGALIMLATLKAFPNLRLWVNIP